MDLYGIAHYIRDHIPFIWNVADIINELCFTLRYGARIPEVLKEAESSFGGKYICKYATEDDVQSAVCFFNKQPDEAFTFFRPHSFSPESLKRLFKNRSFLAFLVYDQQYTVVGYFFLRSFFIGKSYLGKIVDYCHRGEGIGKQMCLTAMSVSRSLGIRMFETISQENLSSLYASQRVLDVKIIRILPDNYLYVEDFPKNT